MISDLDLAQSLLARLYERVGKVGVEQVDFVECETEGDTMAYVYFAGDECVALCFETPPFFDSKGIERLMMLAGDTVVLN